METILTEESLDNPDYSVLVDPYPGSNHLLISFGGIANRLPIPVFEFMRSLERFEVNRIFIRDFNQCWYTNGIKGITKTPLETIQYLKGLIEKYGKDRCVFIGNSAGGYAALLYGQVLGVSEVHAFSPQTFIDSWHRLMYWDRRWKKEIAQLNPASSEYFDLKKTFKANEGTTVLHYLYWDVNHRLDNIHATRLKGSKIHYMKYNSGGHAIIKRLRNTGELDDLLSKALKKPITKNDLPAT